MYWLIHVKFLFSVSYSWIYFCCWSYKCLISILSPLKKIYRCDKINFSGFYGTEETSETPLNLDLKFIPRKHFFLRLELFIPRLYFNYLSGGADLFIKFRWMDPCEELRESCIIQCRLQFNLHDSNCIWPNLDSGPISSSFFYFFLVAFLYWSHSIKRGFSTFNFTYIIKITA